jgi:hypothetical protein
MRSGKRTASGRIGQYLQLIIAAGFCAGLMLAIDQGAAADSPAHDPVEFSIWKKRIRRLKPADPESFEIMFAGARSPYSGTSSNPG